MIAEIDTDAAGLTALELDPPNAFELLAENTAPLPPEVVSALPGEVRERLAIGERIAAGLLKEIAAKSESKTAEQVNVLARFREEIAQAYA